MAHYRKSELRRPTGEQRPGSPWNGLGLRKVRASELALIRAGSRGSTRWHLGTGEPRSGTSGRGQRIPAENPGGCDPAFARSKAALLAVAVDRHDTLRPHLSQAVPKRTNDFQRLIYLVRRHLAEGATVTESKLMRDRVTKRFREVDVCIKGHVGSHPVTVCVECRDHKRVADVAWVDAMKAKHERLETNALILASRSGFTPEARDVAKQYGIETFTLEDVDKADLPALFGESGSLWIKTFTVSADKVRIRVAATAGLDAETVVTTPDNLIYTYDGKELGQVRELVEQLMKAQQIGEYFVKHGTEEHRWAEIVWELRRIEGERQLFMKKIDPELLRQIECVHIVGPCKVDIGNFGLRHSKLGDVHAVRGKASIGGKEAFAVATVAPSGAKKLSVNFSTPTPQLQPPEKTA